MITGDVYLYRRFLEKVLTGTIALEDVDVKAMLVSSDYSPEFDEDHYKSDITNEIVGGGYPMGGLSVPELSVVTNMVTGKVTLSFSSIVFEDLYNTFQYIIFYDDTPVSEEEKSLLFFYDYGEDIIVSGELEVICNSDGVISIEEKD